MNEDIRWIQRFENYKKAIKQFNDAIELSQERELSLLEKQGLIQAFEFTHELAWNLLKDYLEYQGYQDIRGSRDAIKKALSVDLIEDGEVWIQTIKARNITSHAYDESLVQDAANTIINDYSKIFNRLAHKFEAIQKREL